MHCCSEADGTHTWVDTYALLATQVLPITAALAAQRSADTYLRLRMSLFNLDVTASGCECLSQSGAPGMQRACSVAAAATSVAQIAW